MRFCMKMSCSYRGCFYRRQGFLPVWVSGALSTRGATGETNQPFKFSCLTRHLGNNYLATDRIVLGSRMNSCRSDGSQASRQVGVCSQSRCCCKHLIVLSRTPGFQILHPLRPQCLCSTFVKLLFNSHKAWATIKLEQSTSMPSDLELRSLPWD